MKTLIPFAAALLATVAAALHFDAALAGPAFTQARACFLRAKESDRGAVADAVEQFGALTRQEPRNPVYAAYYAAALTARARVAWAPWTKMRYAEEGLEAMDKALSMLTPAHETQKFDGIALALQTRLVAASTFLAVPGFMNRRGEGTRLIHAVVGDPMFASTPRGFQISALRTAVNAAPSPDASTLAAWRQRLAALERTTTAQAAEQP